MRRLFSLFLILALVLIGTSSATPTKAQTVSAWQPNVTYSVGALVTYGGLTYKCIQAHTSLVGWEPPNVPALWSPQSGTPIPPTNTVAPTKTNTPISITLTSPPPSYTPAPPTKTIAPTNTPIQPTATTSGNIPAWSGNGVSYKLGDLVTYQGSIYKCTYAHVSQADWSPTAATTLWQLQPGTVPTSTNTPIPASPTFAPPTNTPIPGTATSTPKPVTSTPTPTSGGTTCAVQSAPTGKVLVGYWESWDNSSIHPGMGWIPLSQVQANYNVIALAFPVLLSDGTAKWETGMDTGVVVPSPAEMCAEKAKGRRLLLSIGGAAAGMDLTSSAVADRFVQTIVPILKNNNFDGIDIDIESGLTAGTSFTQLSASQSNLIRIIDGVLAQMPSNFMLTMAPETAYVTGGQIAYGGPWGAYDPIIKKYVDNGRLSWLQMQYYNGSMYGCNPPGQSYQAGTVDGFVQQTQCMINGFTVAGTTVQIPASKVVVGLPAQPGAGGGYMTPAQVSQAYSQVSSIKGLMTWSINWDGSKGWTFATTKPF